MTMPAEIVDIVVGVDTHQHTHTGCERRPVGWKPR